MRQQFIVAVLFLFAPWPAFSQTSPCSGGATNPLFTAMPGNPVQLTFEHSTIHTFRPTVDTTVAGNDITVAQHLTDIPGLPLVGASSLNCNSQTVSLGALAPGTYNVRWNYVTEPGAVPGPPVVLESYTHSFTIANAVASGGPCWQSARATPVFVVTASRTPGMMHVHYEATTGPLSMLGSPLASVNGDDLLVTQSVYGGAVDPLPGTPNLDCMAEDLDVPALPPGRHKAAWLYATAPGNGASTIIAGFSFQIDLADPLPQTVCASTAAPVALVRNDQLFFSDLVTLPPATFAAPAVEVSGNTITVTERYDADTSSGDSETRCHSVTVLLPFAPQPGSHYEVVWIYKSAYGQLQSTATAQFAPRRRVAR